jgi:hypothetical protein
MNIVFEWWRGYQRLQIQSLLTQMAQSAVCNRRLKVQHRICRWLFLNDDHVEGGELVMT